MATYIKVPCPGWDYIFNGPECRLKLKLCGVDYDHPTRGQLKAYYVAARAGDEVRFVEGAPILKETINYTNFTPIRMSGFGEDHAASHNRFVSGFRVPDDLLNDPQVSAIIKCLKRAPGCIVQDIPFPEPQKLEPLPERIYPNKSNSDEPLPF